MSFRIPRDVYVPAAAGVIALGVFVALAWLIVVLGKIYERPLIVDGGVIELSARARNSTSEACLPALIRDALAQVRAACGPVAVISTLRPHARIPTGHRSLHAACRAADFRVSNYACAYRALASWRYGLSLDGARMRHIHISAPGLRNEGRFYHHSTTLTARASSRRVEASALPGGAP